MDLYIVGVDLAKEVFHLHAANKKGEKLWARKLKRAEFYNFVRDLPRCKIAMEACGGAHHWARKFSELGHEILIIAAQYVKPFVKRNKNDKNDAAAIVETALRPDMHFVGMKSLHQQDVQCLHRVRSRLVHERTAIIQEMRGFLMEYGLVMPVKASSFRKRIADILEDATNELTESVRSTLKELYDDFKYTDKRVRDLEKRLEQICNTTPVCQSLQKRAGFGVMCATALYCEIGDPRVYKNGRQFSASLGLTPKHRGTGGRNLIQGISKRGNVYLRQLMVHGARSVVSKVKLKINEKYEVSSWIKRIEEERGFNKASVALANKNARWAWHVLVGH